MSATDTTEPAVLADAVDFLTPDAERAHSVVDAQFGRSSWGSESIPEAVQTRLTPVSTLSTGAGHPDAMVAPPVSDAYRDPAGEHTDSIPLAVVEAKGTRPGSDSDPDADRIALTQAHAHLETVNVGYAALPSNLVRERSRALARETNTGLLAVVDDGVRGTIRSNHYETTVTGLGTMSVSSHSEPAVLARAKEFLLAETEYSYAVVDTQFSSGRSQSRSARGRGDEGRDERITQRRGSNRIDSGTRSPQGGERRFHRSPELAGERADSCARQRVERGWLLSGRTMSNS